MKSVSLIFCLGVCLLVLACQGNRKTKEAAVEISTAALDSFTKITPTYAQGFSVRYLSSGIRLVDIQDPQGNSSSTYHFALLPAGCSAKDVPQGYVTVAVPVKRVICMTSLQLSNFIALEACPLVAGITSTRHLFNAVMNEQLKQGKTVKIGIEGNFDPEVIMALNPEIIFISPFKRGGYDAIRDVATPLVPHMGYQETSPLGQAEWIKLVGLFVGMETEANEKFAAIERRYKELQQLAMQVKIRPMVFSGELRGGNWYAVGGKSFLAQLFQDAGADYFLKEDTRSGGVTLDFETVYSRAEEADYWRIVNSYQGDFSYEALKASDSRYADFKAFRDRKVLYCNMKEVPFYERMPMQPDEVLADFIYAFHPELLPDHRPVFYHLLP